MHNLRSGWVRGDNICDSIQTEHVKSNHLSMNEFKSLLT